MFESPGLNIRFLKKEAYSGSHQGMRYYLKLKKETIGEEEIQKLVTYIYPDVVCFEKTPEEEKEVREFAFSEEGLDEAISWINTFSNKK